jgi:hypothetical protein
MNTVSLSLFDELGRKVLTTNGQVDELSGSVIGSLSIDKLANGIYYFRIDGSTLYCKVMVRR